MVGWRLSQQLPQGGGQAEAAEGEDRRGAGWQDALGSYPEPHQLGDRRLVLPQGPHIGILLEGRHVVVDIQHIDPDPACGLLATPIPGDDCQGEALDELVVQSGNEHDESGVLVQREPVSGGTVGEKRVQA